MRQRGPSLAHRAQQLPIRARSTGMGRTTCPAEGELSAFDRGDLPPAAQDAIAAHVEGCSACEAILQRLEQAPNGLISALRHPRPESRALATGPSSAADCQPAGTDDPAALAVPAAQPQHIGRYRIERALGQGGFGLVYLAHDDQLQRLVAIKVPHARLVAQTTDAEAYLTEARAVAHLDHPNIVPVYDVGSTAQYPCFVVSKYIEGSTLARRIKKSRPSLIEAVKLVADVAEALRHANAKGLVHRDIKPGNIL